MGLAMCLLVMNLSALFALFSEALSWYMVYRKPEYQRLKRHIEMLVKDLEKKKAEPMAGSVIDSDDKSKKKSVRVVSRLEKDLADATKEIQALTASSKMIVTVLAMLLMLGVNKSFAGLVVAKLPFVPFSLIQKISHRGLEGEDPTDCSVSGVKGNIAKLVGVGHPKGMKEANPFAELGTPVDEGHAKVQ